MEAEFKVIVGRRGVITLPKKMRDQNKIKDGDILYMYELASGAYVLKQQPSKIDQALDKLAEEWNPENISLEEIVQTVREIRAEYYEEHPEDFS